MGWFLQLGSFFQTLIAALFAYAATVCGAAFVFFSGKLGRRAFAVLGGVATGITLAASFFSLLLPALSYSSSLPRWVVLSLGFLLGGIFIVSGDGGISLLQKRKGVSDTKAKKCLLLFSAVALHNIPEGVAIGVAFASGGTSTLSAVMLALGIAIQNLPEGVCLSYPLRAMGYSSAKSFFISQSAGLVEVFSALLGVALSQWVVGGMPWVLSLSAGAMVAVSCLELVEDCLQKDKRLGGLGIVVGFVLMMALDVAFS